MVVKKGRLFLKKITEITPQLVRITGEEGNGGEGDYCVVKEHN